MNQLIEDIFHLFYPESCFICDNSLIQGERHICIACLSELPTTHYAQLKNNEIEKSFLGRIEIEAATALFFYSRHGKVQQLIHWLKYKNQQQIGKLFGDWLGDEIVDSRRFKAIDYIIPVPLHKNKIAKRGYNQVDTFGQSLTNKLKATYLKNVLVKISTGTSQTKKSRLERSKNLEEKFDLVYGEKLNNKHVLLIDDVITTGATLESCCIQLKRAKNVKISIATMAFTLQ